LHGTLKGTFVTTECRGKEKLLTTLKFKKMKYLLKILLLSVALIPFSLWFILVFIWTFDSSELKQLWHDFKQTINSNYRRAFPYKSNSSRKKNIL